MSESAIEQAGELQAGHAERPFEPRIVAFFCNWCTYTASDLAGIARMTYAPNVRVLRLMCSGRVDPQFVLAAFRAGADGVLIGGCHPGDCHYQEGNYKARRRFELLRLLLKDLGIEPERLRLEWISAAEGERVQKVCNEMTEEIRRLGPLRLAHAPGASDGPRGIADLVTEGIE
jgi:F420-non-reducing hydrogenase iron-sulfur subunit